MTTAGFGAGLLDSYGLGVEAAKPSQSLAGLTDALLSDGVAVVLWGTSFSAIPRTSTVTSAVHQVVVAADAVGSVTVELSLNDAGFSTATTWNTKPGPTGAAVAVTVVDPSAGDVIVFDVTAIVQAAVTNRVFPGFQATVTAGADLLIDQTQSSTAVVWEAEGAKVSGLSPDGVVGISKPPLSGGPKNADQGRYQIDPDEHGFGSPAWSSDTVPIKGGSYDLAGSTFPGLAANTPQWWIASFHLPTGWTAYSDPIPMTDIPLLVLTITSPSVQYPVTTDPSMKVTWATTGGTQAGYRVYLTLAGEGDKTILWDSHYTVGSATSLTIPAKYQYGPKKGKPILNTRHQYRVLVEVWDDVPGRVAVPGANVFTREGQVFTFQETPGVEPFSYCVAEAAAPGSSVVQIRCGRLAGGPDQILLWRDNELIKVIEDPSTVVDPDTGDYKILDWEATQHVEHDYYVDAVANGNTSAPSQHALYTPNAIALWLLNEANGWTVKLHNVDGLNLSVRDAAFKIRVLGQRNTNKRVTSRGYLEDTVTGLILSDDEPGGRTSDEYLLDLRRMANNPTIPHTLVYANYSYPVLIGNLTPTPHQENKGVGGATDVEFEVLQQDDWTIFDTLPGPVDADAPDPDDTYTYAEFAAGHNLGIGDADISAISGTPQVHASPVLHTNGEKSWSGGGITRPLLNGVAFADDVYFLVETGTLGSSSSIFTLKNPGGTGDNPADIRLRTAGKIDIKAFDGSTPDTANLQWVKDVWGRGSLRGTWVPDATLGASMGWLEMFVFLYFGTHVEGPFPDDVMYARYPSVAPVNISNGDPSGEVIFETSRRWSYAFTPYAYGVPPAPSGSEPGNALWLGDAQQTTFEVSSYASSYESGGVTIPILSSDLIGLNRSASSAMTSPTSYTAAVPDAEGWNRWSITGLGVNTGYFWQRTVNGTPFGQVCKAKTYKAAGVPQTVKLAVYSCKENAPASTACAADIATYGPDRCINLGDLSYPNNLSDSSQVPVKANWARQKTDPAMQAIAAICAEEYMTSDHDVNGADGVSNKPNFHDAVSQMSMTAWEAVIPARLADVRSPKRGRYRSAVEGNYRYVWVDTRTWDKSDGITDISDDHDSSKTMLGITQLNWLKAEIDAAAAAHQFVFLFTDPAWNGSAEIATNGKISRSTSDKWPAYGFERDLISDYLYLKLGYLVGGVKRVNSLIVFGDTHALQQDDGTNEKNHIASICCGPFSQNVHANFVDAYQRTFPANAGDHVGKQPTQMSYHQVTATESPAGTVNLAIVGRDCTPKHAGTPLTPPGFSVTYGPYTL